MKGDGKAVVAGAGAMTPWCALGAELEQELAAPRSLNEPVIWRFSSFTSSARA